MIAPVPPRIARSSVLAKGFHPKSANRDHEMYFLHTQGKQTDFWFKISRGAREVRIDDIRNNARRLGVRGEDLYKILTCEHDAAATLRVWQSRSATR